MSLTPLPPASFREKYIFFALPSMNVPLPAELKFGENPDHEVVHVWLEVRVRSLGIFQDSLYVLFTFGPHEILILR